MPRNHWTEPTEMLEPLRDSIRRKTQGRLKELVVTSHEGRISVSGKSNSYYGIQLALVAIKEISTQFPHLTPSVLSFAIEDRRIVLGGLKQSPRQNHQPEAAK